jgi:hypothetical protein
MKTTMRVMTGAAALIIASGVLLMTSAPAAQADRHAGFDRILDTYVRDGLVYYRALKIERAPLDRYLRSLDVPAATVASWPVPERQAFWLNAYNALVLRTVVDAYPIRGSSRDYPRDSIRQISGAFDGTAHTVAGERLTLDAIEARMLKEFDDARMVLAIGRGARGGGRLRSEAFSADQLPRQLEEAVKECAERTACFSADLAAGTVTLTPLIGWHASAFERTFVPKAGDRWSRRSPLERAVAAMVSPFLFNRERDMLAADAFTVKYGTFDWSLNEL